jgi:hypothetical protein
MSDYNLVRIKRKWVPEWLFAICAWPIDLISSELSPLRYLLTKKVE